MQVRGKLLAGGIYQVTLGIIRLRRGGRLRLGDQEITGGHIHHRHAIIVTTFSDGGQEVVLCAVQQRIFQ